MMNIFLRTATLVALALSLNAQASVGTLSTGDADTMPDDCHNPYPDVGGFLAFYDNTISMIVAKRGPAAKGVTELFAVSEMRSEIDSRIPNPSGETAIDRLVISQLCQYRDIYAAQNPAGGPGRRILVPSNDEGLQDHLSKIAPKLYKDSREFTQSVLAELARTRHKNDLLEKKRDEIRRARAQGRQRVEDLFVD